MAAGICFLSLFFQQNVFDQQVFQSADYRLSPPLMERMADEGVNPAQIGDLRGERFGTERDLMNALAECTDLSYRQRFEITKLAKAESADVAGGRLSGAEPAILGLAPTCPRSPASGGLRRIGGTPRHPLSDGRNSRTSRPVLSP
jgi:hypothetical protein